MMNVEGVSLAKAFRDADSCKQAQTDLCHCPGDRRNEGVMCANIAHGCRARLTDCPFTAK